MLCGLFAVATSQTTEWKYVGRTPRARFYYNPSKSQDRGSSIIRAWIKSRPVSEEARQKEIRELQGHGGENLDYSRYAYTLYLRDHDCANQQMRLVELIEYTSDGETLEHVVLEKDELKWNPVPPDSIAETLHKAVCAPAKPN